MVQPRPADGRGILFCSQILQKLNQLPIEPIVKSTSLHFPTDTPSSTSALASALICLQYLLWLENPKNRMMT